MENFELQRYITIGQYLPRDSFVHRMDVRAKLLVMILLVAAIMSTWSYMASTIFLAMTFCIVAVSKIPVPYALDGLRPAIPILIAVVVLQLLFLGRQIDPTSPVIWSWSFITITEASLQVVIVSVLRFIEVLILASILTFSSTLTELTHGMEHLLSPFSRLGVPAHELSLIMTIALRFAPTFAQEMETVMKAQASRGADFGESSSALAWVDRTRSMLPLIVPLFLNALERAEELIVAMRARGYMPGADRSQLIELQHQDSDIAAVAATAGFTVFVIFFQFPF